MREMGVMRALGDMQGNRWMHEGGGERDAREGREWREVRVMGCRSQMCSSKM